MVITLFSACASNTVGEENGTDDVSTADDGEEEDKTGLDNPVEEARHSIEYMGATSGKVPDPNSTSATAEEARDSEFPTYVAVMDLIENTYNLDYKWTVISSEAYLTTLTGYIAANTETDLFNTREILADSTINQLIAGGRLAAIDDILEYSDGSAKEYYNDPEKCLYLKAFATVEDGNWYYVPLPNTTASSFDFSNSKYNLRANGQIHGAYSVCVRQDWLDKLGLAMPTTTDEFYEALLEFRTSDVNESGVEDERYYSLLGSDFQTSGIGQWFGLPYTDFIEDPATGKIEVACLTEGYKEFCEYEAKLYKDNLIYIEGSHPWGGGTEIGANTISAIGMMPSNIQFWETGDENSMYYPMPIVQALENVEPRLLIQESQAAFVGFSFRKDCDYQAAATLMDFLMCQDFYMLLKYGIEGVAWDWNEDGSLTIYNLDEIYKIKSEGPALWCNQNALPVCGAHHGNLWGIPKNVYDDPRACLDAGEPYFQNSRTHEEWAEVNHVTTDVIDGAAQMLLYIEAAGKDSYHPTAYYSYTTMATDEEAAFLDSYSSDLKTYLCEMTTNLIVGSKSTDTIDEQIQFAFDNLCLQEYIDVMQARVNRYLVAMGREAVE